MIIIDVPIIENFTVLFYYIPSTNCGQYVNLFASGYMITRNIDDAPSTTLKCNDRSLISSHSE